MTICQTCSDVDNLVAWQLRVTRTAGSDVLHGLAPQRVHALRRGNIHGVAQAQLPAGSIPPRVHLPALRHQRRVAQAHCHLDGARAKPAGQVMPSTACHST